MPSIDPNRFRIRAVSSRPLATESKKPPRPEAGGKFLRGPIPLSWLSRASALPGRSLHVALAIWFMAGLKKVRTVPVSNLTGQQFGLDRNAKYRALEWLEEAQLIKVERRTGQAPIITILEAPAKT